MAFRLDLFPLSSANGVDLNEKVTGNSLKCLPKHNLNVLFRVPNESKCIPVLWESLFQRVHD